MCSVSKHFHSLLLLILILFFSLSSSGFAHSPSPPIQYSSAAQKLFDKARVIGTIVLYDVQENKLIVGNQERAMRPFVPASTFKVLNSLIALETGVVKYEKEAFPWDGKPRPLKLWEKDTTLEEAIRESNVPVFQEIDRRIGKERMLEYVKKVHYGNEHIGSVIDRFWLEGPLKTTAIEQALYHGQFSAKEASLIS